MKTHSASALKEERRLQRREAVEAHEKLQCSLKRDDHHSMQITPSDINAFGMGFSILNEKIPSHWVVGYQTGPLELTLCGHQVSIIPNAVICSLKENQKHKGKTEIGLRFLYENKTLTETITRPEKRLSFISERRPRAQASHPYKLGETLLFEVDDISASGARVTTSLRNRLLWKDTVLKDFTITMHGQDPIKTSAKVTYVTTTKDNKSIYIGLKFQNITNEQRSALIRGALQFAELDQNEPLRDIREAGFKPKFIRDQLDFSYAHSSEEYQKVLSLRKEAYSRSGKIALDASPEIMADEYDKNSKIIIAKYKNEIVGSMRITFCKEPKDRFELDASIVLPKKIQRLQTIEISRLCVDGRFENTDVVLGLIERATVLSVQLGVQKIITSCIREMLPYYSKLGFYPTGLKFELATLNNIPHYLLIHDSKTHLYSFKLNPLYWMFTFKRSIEFLANLNYLDHKSLPLLKKVEALFYRALLKLKSYKRNK